METHKEEEGPMQTVGRAEWLMTTEPIPSELPFALTAL